jgi:channel protein (hemolysin III family)
MIFVLIAGSFTPIALLSLRPSWSVAMVSIAWAGP